MIIIFLNVLYMGGKYAYAVRSWKNNWENLTQFFEYPLEIRKIVYTTNIIETWNQRHRKYTKTKSIFPHDQAALKAVFLAIGNIEKNGPYQSRIAE